MRLPTGEGLPHLKMGRDRFLVERSIKGKRVLEGFETGFNGLNIFWGKIHKMTSYSPFIDIDNFRL